MQRSAGFNCANIYIIARKCHHFNKEVYIKIENLKLHVNFIVRSKFFRRCLHVLKLGLSVPSFSFLLRETKIFHRILT